jgi:hypothetical protein
MIEEFDHRVWHGQSDHRAGGDLPEPAGRVGRVVARPDRVGVRVAVQPQHDVREPVQQGEQVGGAEQRLAARPGVLAARCWSACLIPWWENRITSRSSWPVRTSLPSAARVGRVHLAEPGFQPPGLLPVQAPGRAAGQAVGVQRDEPGGRRVVDVVRGAVEPVLLAEPVPERPRAGSKVRVDEVPPGDRPAEGISVTCRDGPAMNASGRVVNSSSAGHGRSPAGSPVGFLPPVSAAARPGVWTADALVEGLVIAEAGQPGDAQAGGGELAQRAPAAPGNAGSRIRAGRSRAAGTGAVRSPEDVARPVKRLHPLVVRPAGIRRHHPAVEQGEERLQFVPLRVVDRVARGHGQLQRQAGRRAVYRAERADGGVDRVRVSASWGRCTGTISAYLGSAKYGR